MAIAIHVTIKAAVQGTLKGQGLKPESGRIPVVSFELGVVESIDPGSGLPSGRRQHKPVVFRKEVGAASPQLFQAAVTNEVLKSVVFEFMKSSPEGKEVVDHSVTLTNAVICSFRDSVQIGQQGGPVVDSRELEEISLSFQKIEMVNVTGGTQAVDDWMGD
ncbi:MAG TPA: type VI secretion system tube protein TssD [Candidatus Sulfotelmatobacter sp.]|nr:type VI secretion system tube protein TssD [Candidatus Sulfotelmatobacter sp.]